jgi:hypothetical protein
MLYRCTQNGASTSLRYLGRIQLRCNSARVTVAEPDFGGLGDRTSAAFAGWGDDASGLRVGAGAGVAEDDLPAGGGGGQEQPMELLEFAEVVADALPFEGGEEELFDLGIALGWFGDDGERLGFGFPGQEDVGEGFQFIDRSVADDHPIGVAGQVPQEDGGELIDVSGAGDAGSEDVGEEHGELRIEHGELRKL